MRSRCLHLWTSILALTLGLAGCGIGPAAPTLSSTDAEFDASGRRSFPYGLGADTSRDPGVTADEDFSTQALPVKIDLRKYCSPVADQGKFGSCTAFASVKGLQEFLLKKQGRYKAQSAAYLWYQTRRHLGKKNEDSGAPTDYAVKMLDAYGTVPESDFPYLAASKQENEKARIAFLTRQPSSELVSTAKKFRIVKGYKVVTKLSAIRKSLSEGTPVLLAMHVFDNISKTPKSGEMPMPTASSKHMGGHAVLAVGYDTQKRMLIVRNSWGSKWADGGYFYMPYEYVKLGGVRIAVVPKL